MALNVQMPAGYKRLIMTTNESSNTKKMRGYGGRIAPRIVKFGDMCGEF